MADDAVRCLQQYDFPGNAMELRNLMERAFVLCRGRRIEAADLPTEVRSQKDEVKDSLSLRHALEQAERKCLHKALQYSQGNRTNAARILGISRKNLEEKIKIHDIDWESVE